MTPAWIGRPRRGVESKNANVRRSHRPPLVRGSCNCTKLDKPLRLRQLRKLHRCRRRLLGRVSALTSVRQSIYDPVQCEPAIRNEMCVQ